MRNRWFLLLVVSLVGFLVLSSCSTPPPSSPTSSPPVTQSSSAPSPTPSQTAQPTPSHTTQPSPSQSSGVSYGIVPYPPGIVIHTSTNHNTGSDGKSITITSIRLETTDPYEQVKAYYQSNQPAGFLDTMSGETTGEDGNRTYNSYLVRPDNEMMIVLNIYEAKAEGKVSINQTMSKPD
jgi:cytoskeletal protein RodZ